MQKQLLRLPQVRQAVGLSRSEIYRLMAFKPPRFPKAIPLGERVVAWDASEVQAWIAKRIELRERLASADSRPVA